MPDAHLAPPDEYREAFPPSLVGRLPLLVRLRDFWNYLPQTPGCQEMTQKELEASLARWIDAKQHGGLAWSCVAAHLEQGSLLMILDGVDEVPLSLGDAQHPVRPRPCCVGPPGSPPQLDRHRQSRALDESAIRLERAGCRSAAAPRRPPIGSRRPGAPVAGAALVPLPARSCGAGRPGGPADAGSHRPTTGRRPANGQSMLLTAMCIIYQQGHRLPQNRCELYDRIVNNVLFNRFPEDLKVIDPVRNRLAVVAYGCIRARG